MRVIGYIRVSTYKQDLEKQKHTLLEYVQRHKLMIDQFIEVEISSRRTKKERRIAEYPQSRRSADGGGFKPFGKKYVGKPQHY